MEGVGIDVVAVRQHPNAIDGQRRQPDAFARRRREVAEHDSEGMATADLVVAVGHDEDGAGVAARRPRKVRASRVASSAQWASSTTATTVRLAVDSWWSTAANSSSRRDVGRRTRDVEERAERPRRAEAVARAPQDLDAREPGRRLSQQ